MSRIALKNLLTRTLEDIEGNAAISRVESNKQPHEFTISRQSIKQEIYSQLNKKNYLVNGKITAEMREIVTNGVQDLADSVWEEGKKLRNKKEAFLTGRKDGVFSVVVIVAQDIVKYRTEASGQVIKYHTSSDDIFNSIKALYKPHLRNIRANLNTYFKESSEVGKGLIPSKNIKTKKDKNGNIIKQGRQADTLLQLGHDELDSVADQRISSGKAEIFREVSSIGNENGDLREIEAFLKNQGFEVSFDKQAKKDKTVIKVRLQSQFQNQGLQAAEEKFRVKQFKTALRRAIDNLGEAYALSEGSDSRVDIEKKKVLKRVKEKLNKHKNIKTNFKNTSLKLGNAKAKNKITAGRTKPRVKANTSTGFTINSAQKQKPSKGRQESYFSLIPLINRTLPGVVRANMGAPALENISGKFAESARVTEIITTRKGYPSIGYTYDKNPYQIFEPGKGKAPWATSDRDPRKVIDKSIREIVTGLIQERFYTRRL